MFCLVTPGHHCMCDLCRPGSLLLCYFYGRDDWYSNLLHIHGHTSRCEANDFLRSIVSISECQISKTFLVVRRGKANVLIVIETRLWCVSWLHVVESLLETERCSHSKRWSYYIRHLIRGETLLGCSFRRQRAINRESQYKYESNSENVFEKEEKDRSIILLQETHVCWYFEVFSKHRR